MSKNINMLFGQVFATVSWLYFFPTVKNKLETCLTVLTQYIIIKSVYLHKLNLNISKNAKK